MADIHCLLCDSDNLKTYIHSAAICGPWDILKCRNCGLVFMGNHNHHQLDDSYWNGKRHMEIYEAQDVQNVSDKNFQKELQRIEELKERGKLLDIGCGLGHFLRLARQDGWKVWGVEIAHPAVEYARNNFSLDIYAGTVENCNLKDTSIDVVTMWDVIEHIENPLETLAATQKKLKKGGLLVIKTPDEKSLFKKGGRFLYLISGRKISFLLKYLYYLPHYFYYNRLTIQKLLEKFGFKIIKIEGEMTDYHFAREKIKLHYKKFFSRNLVLILLPVVFFLSRIFRIHNKMVIYAVKA